MSSDVPARYESLRAQVFEPQPSQDHGWAVFIRSGLLAWSELASDDRRYHRARHRQRAALPFVDSMCLDHRVIQVLAAMVVQLQPEVPHGR